MDTSHQPNDGQSAMTHTRRRPLAGPAAACLLTGTIMYVAATAFHGNPPITDAAAMLDLVAGRPFWPAEHYLNIGAVILWMIGFTLMGTSLPDDEARGIRKSAHAVIIAGTAVFSVYFALHALGLESLSSQWVSADAAGRADAELAATAVIAVLGALAFVAQAMLGISILLYALVLVRTSLYPSWLGWTGAVAGSGWFVGAMAMNFAIIVPFTLVTWVWIVLLSLTLVQRRTAANSRPR
ncbi:hypothetical protein [Arthrobacter castelli]|uniref:hypothetical protein n=1 Tax=Arthrobacter castelli TaxID=271431 RepID=UPI0004287124|nr:hypothetical protein [Arthrobacter castelli]